MQSIYQAPSIYAHITNGILLFIAMILIYRNYKTILKLNIYERIVLLLLFSLAIGLHGLSHLGLESVYNWNPMGILLNS